MSLPRVMVLDDGTQELTSFNDMAWGGVSRARMDWINRKLRQSSFDKAIQKAKERSVQNQGGSTQSDANAMDVDGEEMVDLSDDECECSFLSNLFALT